MRKRFNIALLLTAAVVMATVMATPTLAQPKASDITGHSNPGFAEHAEVKSLRPGERVYDHILAQTQAYYQAWSYTREDTRYNQAGQFYDRAAGNIYWDPLPPLQGHSGWQQYQHVIEKVWLPAEMEASGILFAGDRSFRAWQLGDIVWTTSNCLVHAQYAGGNSNTSACRGTQVWQRQRNGAWLIVHEHFSAAQNPGGKLFFQPDYQPPRVSNDKAFLQLTREYASHWAAGPLSKVSQRLAASTATQRMHWYLPWPPHDGLFSHADMQTNVDDYLGLISQELQLQIHDGLQLRQSGDIAWTAATVTLTLGSGETARPAHGRQTLIWLRKGDNWQVVHEHLSLPVGGN